MASTSEVAQLVEFMKKDLNSRTSNMIGFLSKRARLMIRYSLELLGNYLSVLKDPRTEKAVDLNSFLEDISASLEEFKERERNIRSKHFHSEEDSEMIDPGLAQNPVFNLSDVSQLHAILSVFKPPNIEVDMLTSSTISLTVAPKAGKSLRAQSTNRRSTDLLREAIEVPHQRIGRGPASSQPNTLNTYYIPKQEMTHQRSRSASRERDTIKDNPYWQNPKSKDDDNLVLAKFPLSSKPRQESELLGRQGRPEREPIPEYTEVATKDFDDDPIEDRLPSGTRYKYGNILPPNSDERKYTSTKKGSLRSDALTNPELSFSERKPADLGRDRYNANYEKVLGPPAKVNYESLRTSSRSPPDDSRKDRRPQDHLVFTSAADRDREDIEDHPRESSDPRSVKSTKSAVGAVLAFQPNKPRELGRPEKNQLKSDGFQKVKYDNGTYEGYVKEGKRHGKGVYVWNDGSRYEGDWYQDLKQGKGVFRWDNGDVYEGSFFGDHREGKGKKSYANGDEYDGTWARGKKHGRGNFYSSTGDHYSGDFKNNKRDGFGVKIWSGGAKYEGTWKADRMHGEGKFTWPQGDWYKGDYLMGMRTGKGTKVWASGTQYEGEWVNDKREGTGTITYADGKTYTGEFKDNLKHGYGEETYPNGHSIVGYWQEGSLVKQK